MAALILEQHEPVIYQAKLAFEAHLAYFTGQKAEHFGQWCSSATDRSTSELRVVTVTVLALR